MRKGFVFIPAIIIVAVIAIAAVFSFSRSRNKTLEIPADSEVEVKVEPSSTPSPTSTPTFTPAPTLKPKPTALPTKKPVSSTPTSAQTSCSQFNPEAGLTTITITLKEKNNQPLTGDWIVKIKPTGFCPGILPPGWGGEINDVVRQPNYTYKSPGMHPGQFRIDVQYHYTGEGFDFDGISGGHSREVQVSN